ncbi:CLUMA_CG008130, isoform A [Clunio marinus]|uniref:DNA polymerase alpha subunit B n=1 Tax=Clunio marinus TaxID=568069 RepID=A0A1J1I6Q7_9DIPT|nr:CLUMA_CG008130, isoform A [Clunio marinus]
MAFSISHLEGAEPTIQYLIDMENKEYKNQIRAGVKPKQSSKPSALKVYNHDSDDEENDLLGAYVCITPKNDKKAASKLQHRTPDVTKTTTTFTPDSYSPLTTTKRSRVAESVKSGNVVYTFGNFMASANESRDHQQVTVKIAELKDGTQWINKDSKYMMISAQDDGQLISERIFNIGKEITKKILSAEGKTEELMLSHCDVMSHETVRCLGRIFCGGRGDKLDQKSAYFIGFDENKLRIVQLDFSKLKPSVQVFPGEVCIISGTNPRGKIFYVTEIHSERMLENSSPSTSLTSPLHLMIASGPFTADDNLLFEYLEKLLVNCQNNQPDVLILTGAFLPMKSQLIFDVATELDEHFQKILAGISERVGENTKVVIVSSSDDINSSACFPTHPYKVNKIRPFPNIFMAPDPSIIDINGVQIGITSVDITQQLADAEFCVNAGADKTRRYINYLFHQMSFYPLFPPKIPTDIRLLHENGAINKIPNILVVPSDMKFYMRDFNNCLCVNPGRVMKDGLEGTIARLVIKPTDESTKAANSWISGQIIYI